MKIAYITAQAPYGKGETFIMDEIMYLRKQGIRVFVVPRNPSKSLFNGEFDELNKDVIYFPLISFTIILNFLIYALKRKNIRKLIYEIIKESKSLTEAIKNMIIIPKSVYVAKILRDQQVEHVHSHWGSTTSTMALIISEIISVPWSFTLHRWDIYENNLLRKKVEKASFIRCISEKGKMDLLKIVGGQFEHKIKVIHMGVSVNSFDGDIKKVGKEFVACVPGNLVPVKGHKFLIEACKILKDKGFSNFKVLICGEGRLKNELIKQVKLYDLDDNIIFCGRVPHDKLLSLYEKRKIDIVILPSINTSNGEFEGIPVALMEAMSYGIPVISTKTGGIPELLNTSSGMLVEEKNPSELAEAILVLLSKEEFRKEISMKGYEKVKNDFNINKITEQLISLFKECKAKGS